MDTTSGNVGPVNGNPKQRCGIRPMSMFLIGWGVTAVVAMAGMYLAVGVVGGPDAMAALERSGEGDMPWNWSSRYTGVARFQRRTDAASVGEGGMTGSFDNIKLTMEHDLMGRNAVAQAAEELRLLEGLPRDIDGMLTPDGQMGKQEIVAKLQRGIQLTWEVKTPEVDLVAVRVRHADPTIAAQLPNQLVTNYINRISGQIVDRLTASRDFLAKKVYESEARLKAMEKKRLDFETTHAAAMPDDPGALNDRIRRLEGEIETSVIIKGTATAKLEKLRGILSKATSKPAEPLPKQPNTPPAGFVVTQVVMGANPELVSLKEQLRKLTDDFEAERAMKKSDAPLVVALQKKIVSVQERIARTPEQVVLQRVYAPAPPVDSDLLALQAQIAAVEAELRIATTEQDLLTNRLEPLLALRKNFVVIRQEYTWVTDEITRERSELDTWQRRYAGVQTDLSAEVAKKRTHLSAVESAEERDRPDTLPLAEVAEADPLAALVGLAIMVGLIGGVALAILSALVNRRVARRALA